MVTESEKEKTEEGAEDKSTDDTDLAAKLPDPPTTEPKDPEATQPPPKRQKMEALEDDFVVLDKEDVKEAKEAEAEAEAKAAPKADL